MTRWKTLPSDSRYEISSDGRVRRKAYELRPQKASRTNHLQVSIGKRNIKPIHRLVAETFIGPAPKGAVVNHKNCDAADNRVENLEYCTQKQNIQHAARNGRMLKRKSSVAGENNPRARLTWGEVRRIRTSNENTTTLGKAYGVNSGTIWFIKKGLTWQEP